MSYDIIKLTPYEAETASNHLVGPTKERVAGALMSSGMAVVKTEPDAPVVLTQLQVAIQELLEAMGYEKTTFRPTRSSALSLNVLMTVFERSAYGRPVSDKQWYHIKAVRDRFLPELKFDWETDIADEQQVAAE